MARGYFSRHFLLFRRFVLFAEWIICFFPRFSIDIIIIGLDIIIMDSSPRLIEPGAKYFLYNTLTQCHSNRVNVYYWGLNIGVFVVFICIFGAALYYCHKRKLTPEEQYNKMMKEQAYILSKIRFYQNERIEHPLSSITSLPVVKQNDEFSRMRV
jgi:hypothetical protein